MAASLVDPRDIVPKYYQLVSIMRHKIEDGEWEPYDLIPSERELEKQYNISRTTIRQALAILVRQGYLYREHGRGTFVAPQKLQQSLHELVSFTEDMRKRGMQPGQVIRFIGYTDPLPKVVQALELPPDTEKLFLIERIRLADGQPIGMQASYLNLPNGQTITREEMEQQGSLYKILQEKFNMLPTEAEETIEATQASPDESMVLNIPEGSPLLLTSRILYAQNRRPVEYVKILLRGDRYKYVARLVR
jgi:GntR family transcriptional regulator